MVRFNEIKNIVVNILRSDLREEARFVLDNCNADELTKFIKLKNKYKDSFGNIACMEIDFLKSKLEYLGRIPIRESDLGISSELKPFVLDEWRDEKLKGIL